MIPQKRSTRQGVLHSWWWLSKNTRRWDHKAGEAKNRERKSKELLTPIITTTLQGSDRYWAGWQKMTGHRKLCCNDVCRRSVMSFHRRDRGRLGDLGPSSDLDYPDSVGLWPWRAKEKGSLKAKRSWLVRDATEGTLVTSAKHHKLASDW